LLRNRDGFGISFLVGSTLLSNSLFLTLVLLLTEGRIKDLRCLLGYASGGGGLGSHRRFEAIINAILAIDSKIVGLAIQGNCAKAVALGRVAAGSSIGYLLFVIRPGGRYLSTSWDGRRRRLYGRFSVGTTWIYRF
jgi:hypothetical protein